VLRNHYSYNCLQLSSPDVKTAKWKTFFYFNSFAIALSYYIIQLCSDFSKKKKTKKSLTCSEREGPINMRLDVEHEHVWNYRQKIYEIRSQDRIECDSRTLGSRIDYALVSKDRGSVGCIGLPDVQPSVVKRGEEGVVRRAGRNVPTGFFVHIKSQKHRWGLSDIPKIDCSP
jgi:hypothetical protein